MKSQGRLIRDFRVRRGLSKSGLASLAECSTQVIDNVEAGVNIWPKNRAKLARAMRMSLPRFEAHPIGSANGDHQQTHREAVSHRASAHFGEPIDKLVFEQYKKLDIEKRVEVLKFVLSF